MKAPRETAYRLPLIFCKLASANRSRRREGTPSEAGFSLQVALLVTLMLLIGISALASRTSSGFISAVFQESNRDARDVAESAIGEFANTMNREPNRYLLTVGDTATWANATNRNPCTQYNADGSIIDSDSNGTQDPATTVSNGVITRFSPSVATFQNLVGDQARRRFRVESIEYRRADATRTQYSPADTAFISDIRSGGNRTLIRITVVGEVEQGGRVSTARIAKEYEVVPKCCKRSFGRNTIGAVNWGRDSNVCLINEPGDNTGVIVGLDGGGISGSNNQKRIYDENLNLITQALCWSGNAGGSSVLNGTVNTTCTDGTMALGNPSNPNNTGISFAPAELSFTFPDYRPSTPAPTSDLAANPTLPLPSPLFPTVIIPNNSTRYIAYVNGGVRLCEKSNDNPGNYQNCTRLDGPATATTDPCYKVSSLDLTATPPRPYYRYNCQLQTIASGNNSNLYIDTSAAQINIMFYDSAYTGSYIDASGNTVVTRVHCRPDLNTVPSGTTACATPITWDTFLQTCTLTDCAISDYDVRRLLNIYANGRGSFILNGTAAGVGLNLYAPKASQVELRGGGNADPNFMGRLWTDDLYLNGTVKINTYSSAPYSDGPTNTGKPIIDFMARSFTQSSGFGL